MKNLIKYSLNTLRSLSSLFGDFFGEFYAVCWIIVGTLFGSFCESLINVGNILGTFGNISGNFGKFWKMLETLGKPMKIIENQKTENNLKNLVE